MFQPELSPTVAATEETFTTASYVRRSTERNIAAELRSLRGFSIADTLEYVGHRCLLGEELLWIEVRALNRPRRRRRRVRRPLPFYRWAW